MPTTVAARPHTYRPRLTIHAPTDAERERDLIERARGGDREAFGVLLRAQLPAAIRLAKQIVRNDADAEDVVQDAVLAAVRSLDRFEAGRPFWPWLSRIIVNRAIDFVAAKTVRAADDIPISHPSSTESPLRSAEQAELGRHVRRVLSQMSPRQRLIVEMFDLQGASVAEIADLTGAAPATVRWHLHMGRRALRKALSHLYGGDT